MVGNFQRVAGARLHEWWCSPTGLKVGEVLVVMTVDDAQRMRLDDHATALAYLSTRFGPGRYHLTPRTDQGTKLPGTQSLVAIIEEDSAMQVTLQSPSLTAAQVSPPLPMDRDTAIEIERRRLQAELERERETRRENASVRFAKNVALSARSSESVDAMMSANAARMKTAGAPNVRRRRTP